MTSAHNQITAARTLLVEEPERPGQPVAALGAAFLAATAAVLMAGVVVLGPGFTIDETTWAAPPR
ncbi:MAG: peptidoglycan-binding protein [Brevundimonas sp.]|uniref:peptidoglycan-binding protein n=1 Tax=Brevundimonas sp. TaxID=1871086 RepID=UPI00403399D8